MTENKRFTIKPQDDLFGVVDNYSADKVCVVNGIRTEIEAKWLCKDMNALNNENEELKQQLKTKVIVNKQYEELQRLKQENEEFKKALMELKEIGDYQEGRIKELNDENEQLKQVVEEFIENKTQHNLWKLRTILKELKGDLE